MIRSGLLLSALLLVACAEAPPPAAVATVPVSPPIASASAPPAIPEATPAPIAAAELNAVALPDVTACVLTTAQWRGAKPKSELRARAGGPVFATVRAGQGSLHLPVGSAADGAILEIADRALALRGHVAASDVWIHPGKPFLLGAAVIPLADARLEWTGAKPGAVDVTFDPHEGITLVRPPLAADVPCDALSLDFTLIDAPAAVPGLAKTTREGLLRADRAVPLSITAGGPVIANLGAKPGVDARITVIGSAGQDSRILWSREKSAIFGWVPTAALEFPKQLPPRMGYGTGSGSGSLGRPHALFRVACPDDVTAVVEIGGERWMVGRILAGTTIHVMSDEGEYRTVIVLGNGLQMSVDARLMASAARLLACPKVP